ncbi:site-specific DNA-methyltransferase [Cohaesibacter haloalkalitolerans]|uniref:site-specific DNA-methyltransferase n=1 Tax=Cohaesibacter haloalkalitolerans TaxID=1162980 RepID=UPI001FE15E69|nr:site-specific DNA-methyltransferase [Cohaesibacter haloalkalitolerans]
MTDEIETLKMHSPDLTQDNIAKIRTLFPGCVTEARGEDGKLSLKVDFDQLRQELSDSIVEGPQERYHLDWPGKREALITANAPIAKTLRPCREESVDFDTTKNLFIEGDNLEALKLLQETYLGKVKLIYIDPPYNTGNDFIYHDKFVESGSFYLNKTNQIDFEENKLVSNPLSDGRYHSNWLNMMFPRLIVSRNLLCDGGVILISCDDVECHNIRKICDEIFGVSNFIAQFVWKARQFTDTRAKTNVSTDHEYIVAYSKSGDTTLHGVKRDENKFANPDSDPRGPWMSRSILGLATQSQRPNLHYDIVEPLTSRVFPPSPASGWRYSKEKMDSLIKEGCIIFPKKDDGRPREKKFRKDMTSEMIAFRSVIDDVFTADGTKDLRDLFSDDVFPFPKPVKLIRSLIEQVADEPEDIILDFFAGSGTTANATIDLSAIDGINRHVISIQLPEKISEGEASDKFGFKSIADLSKERIRRAGEKILEGESHPDWNKDVGFRVLKIDSSNMADTFYTPDQTAQGNLLASIDNIKLDRTPEDLLFQVLIDWGVDLTYPITRETLDGKTVFSVAGTALMACFDNGVDEALVKKLAERKPMRIVFKDTGFKDDATKINVRQIFKALSPDTEVKAI